MKTLNKMQFKIRIAFRDDPNSLEAWNLTLWGQEILAQLEEKYLAPNFVNRDYATDVNRLGETVNARIRGEMKFKRRNIGSPVKTQPLVGTSVPLKLNQMWHTAFVVDDWGATKTFGNIIDDYLTPAANALARGVHCSVLGLSPQFLSRRAGALGTMSPTNALSYVTDLNGAMNVGQDWGGAPLFVDNDTRTNLLKVQQLVKVNEAGMSETLRRAYLGDLMDMSIFKTSDTPGNRARAAVNSTTTSASATKGAAGIAVTSATGITVGKRISVAGRPYKVTGVAGTDITLGGGLLEDVASGATVSEFGATAINYPSNYAAGWSEGVLFDDAVVKGDVLDIGSYTYTVVQIDGTEILLDRPLEEAVNDGTAVYYWPAGAYNFTYSPGAIMMAARALPQVPPGIGAQSVVTSFNGLPIRINMTYLGDYEQVRVNISILGGLAKVMDNEGGVLLT